MQKSFILLSVLISINTLAKDKVVYGHDNRVEGTRSPLRYQLKAVAAMIDEDELKKNDSLYIARHYSTLNNVRGKRTCSNLRFRSQPTIGSCTGFLIAPNKLLTAGHCVLKEGQRIKNRSTSSCLYNKWVFDYNLNDVRSDEVRFNSSRVASCKKIIDGAFNDYYDYAIIELNKPINASPLNLSYDYSDYQNGKSVMTLGHPSGLPSKVTAGARIKRNQQNFIITDLDTFAGNSGSPVLNNYGEVIAILVSGEIDYFYDKKKRCYRENRCTSVNGTCDTMMFMGPQGEKASKLSAIKTNILKALR